ncbi:MAG TPA: type II toxin-antitoxin system VapC family toxin, partial [Thermoanaerobaculia bacterium]
RGAAREPNPMRRIFVDTNVFLRFLTQDDLDKAERARRLFASAVAGEVVVETSLLVIAEIVWTLESFYGLTHDEIAEQVTTILTTPNFECPNKELLLEALPAYTEHNVDFIDAYHAAFLQRRHGVSLATFDRKHFRRFPGLDLFDL